jgi:hypothetical protein
MATVAIAIIGTGDITGIITRVGKQSSSCERRARMRRRAALFAFAHGWRN